jgi:hypothetical protein
MGYWFSGHTEHLVDCAVKGKVMAFRCLVNDNITDKYP